VQNTGKKKWRIVAIAAENIHTGRERGKRERAIGVRGAGTEKWMEMGRIGRLGGIDYVRQRGCARKRAGEDSTPRLPRDVGKGQ